MTDVIDCIAYSSKIGWYMTNKIILIHNDQNQLDYVRIVHNNHNDILVLQLTKFYYFISIYGTIENCS